MAEKKTDSTGSDDSRFNDPAAKTITAIIEKSDEYWQKHKEPTEIKITFTPNDGAKVHFKGNYQQAIIASAWMFAGIIRQMHVDPDAHNYAMGLITKAMYDSHMDEEGTGSFKEED